MACKISIKKTLEDQVTERAIGLEGAELKIAQQKAKEINTSYESTVVKVSKGVNDYTNKVVVGIPSELVDKYHTFFTTLEIKEAADVQNEDALRAEEEFTPDYMFQTESLSSSQSSIETLKTIKEAAKKMGIDIQKLSDYLKGNPDINAKGINGLADVVRGVVAIAEGKENVALTEEIVHVARAMLAQTHPNLVTEMIAKIDRFGIYKRVFEQYKDNKNYQLSNGKPDIRKIKEEAVDKLLTEVIINKNEGDTEFPELRQEANRSIIRVWWDKMLDAIRGIYKKVNIDIFQDVANRISTGEVENVKAEGGVYYQIVSDEQKSIQDKLISTQQTLRKQSVDKSDDLLEEDEADNFYEVQKFDGTWERVKHRVTDRVKGVYNRLFRNKVFTEAEKKYNEARRTAGVLFHSYMEEIHARWFNEDGTKRNVPVDRPNMSDYNKEVYFHLENYFSDLIKSLPEDTLVFSEIKVYDVKKDEAGTIDFFAIDKTGKGHILDWKFMTLKDNDRDIPFYKKNAYDVQLGRYKDILKEQYGLKSVGMIRAIPAIMRMTLDKTTDEYVVNGINIGNVDVSKITDIQLLPVSERTESTGIIRLDKVIGIINAMLSNIKTSKVTDEDSRQFKNERLNLIARALRFAQTAHNLTPLTETISKIKQEGDNILNDWNTTWKDRGFKGIIDKEKSDFGKKMHDYMDIALAYKEIDELLRKVIYDKDKAKEAKTEDEIADFKYRKEIADSLHSEVEDITESRKEIEEISKDFVNKFIGWANNIPDMLEPEVILRGLNATFDNISKFSHTAFQALNRIVTDATLSANRNALVNINKILEIRKQLKANGNIREVTSKLYQKDEKGNNVNRLIYKYDKEFYNKLEENSKLSKPSLQWLEENIDIEAYKQDAKKYIDRRTIQHQNDYKHDEKVAEGLIKSDEELFDIGNPNFHGWDNWMIRQHPLEKWLSKEYKEIQSNKSLVELYNLIWDMNHKAASIGYIDNRVINIFLPFMKRGFAEKIAWNENPLEMMNWERSLRVNPEDVGLGKMNELSGKYEHIVPKYFTYDFTREGEKASEDIFKNLILYFSHVEKYEALTNLEGQVKILEDVEGMKEHLDTNWYGKAKKYSQGKAKRVKGNDENVAVLDKFIRVLIYGEKYVSDNSDMSLDIHPQEAMKKLVNTVAGHEVYKIDENPDPISVTKVIDAMNQYFRVKTLGGNFVSGLAVYFGSSMQVMEQAGRYFTAGEFRKNNAILFRNKAVGKDKELWTEVMNTFMPLREDIANEKLKTAGMSAMTNLNLKNKLMMVMSLPSMHIEQSIFMTLLDNSMIENGKIVNIREFVNSKYSNKYSSSQEFKDSKDKIEDEIKELQKTRSISNTMKLENNKLVIPGLDLTNTKELDRLTKLTRRISETSTHGRTASDANQSAMNIWLNSMMVFKTWMPKLIDTRFGVLKKTADDFSVEIDDEGHTIGEKYDMGRIRLMLHTMGFNIFKGAMKINDIIKMNDNGIKLVDGMFEEYAKEYEDRTGKTLNMTRDDFIDMVRNNLHNEVRELGMLLLLTAALFSTGLLAPGDPKDKAAKNSVNFFVKCLNKFHGQLGMFYDPLEWYKVFNGGMFPALGVFGDIGTFIKHSTLAITGIDAAHPFSDKDDVRKKAQAVKYTLEMFPLSKAFITYMSMLDTDFAKDWNVNVSSQNLK